MANLSLVDELQTLRDWVRWGASYFRRAGLCFGHSTEDAFDEALFLARHVLHLEHEEALAYLDARLAREEREAVMNLFERRVEERLPAPYLTGEAWFAGLPFRVDKRVLVPRSPIAELIEAGFQPWLEESEAPRVLDLCTGSGCIAIATAHYLPGAQVDACDLSAEALDVARENVALHGVEEQVRLYQSDLFDALPEARYHLIVSNPPYVTRSEMAALPEEYRHEPAMGLEAGEDGLTVVSRILAEGDRWLHPGGIMVVEVGESMENLQRRYPEVPFLWLEFERGGGGVFLLTAEQLQEYKNWFSEE